MSEPHVSGVALAAVAALDDSALGDGTDVGLAITDGNDLTAADGWRPLDAATVARAINCWPCAGFTDTSHGERAYNAVKKGYLRGLSIGYAPTKAVFKAGAPPDRDPPL